jgi:hypothetical protein
MPSNRRQNHDRLCSTSQQARDQLQSWIPLAELGFSTHAATVTCNASWLNCEIIGDSVRLIAEAFKTAGTRSNSVRIYNYSRSVTIIVYVRVSRSPRQTNPATPTRRETVWTVVSVALVLGVLLFLAIIVA